LRKVLGTHVTQAGSLVDATRLRFDFAHNKPLSPDEIRRVEKLVNDEIANQLEVATNEMEHQAAIAAGALALFGEKYGDRVRVVQMGDFSTELCGGTHVSNTAHIRLLVVVSESGVSAGVRRIEAITGEAAYQFVMRHTYENQAARLAIGLHESWSTFLHGEASSKQTTVYDWIEQSKAQVKALERELKSAKGSSIDIDALLKTAHHFDNHGVKGQLITASVEVDDRQILSDLSDRLKDKIKTGVVVLVGRAGDDSGKHPITVAVTKDLTAKLSAGKMLSEIAAELKGKGGGRPDFAQGAGEDLSRVPQAFATAVRLVQ
jgi:alanyl-tRNA synthetase